MQQLLYALPVLACPVGTGAMMWFMMRGKSDNPDTGGLTRAQSEEIARLQAELDGLRAGGTGADPTRADTRP